jgi:hypothetical protein
VVVVQAAKGKGKKEGVAVVRAAEETVTVVHAAATEPARGLPWAKARG